MNPKKKSCRKCPSGDLRINRSFSKQAKRHKGNGVVAGVSASLSVDLDAIPLSNYLNDFKNYTHSFPAWFSVTEVI